MEGAVEILEVLMGFVANTVSFIRVAAFGLAHAALFLAVFGIADAIAASPLGGVLSILVLILGNIIIIVLEGLVVVIQALRLEYYEFFGKFFKETGTKFDPVGFS
jgi:V/A-type H+-transporting ATPase subunit I